MQVISGDLPLNKDQVAQVSKLCAEPLLRSPLRLVFDLNRVPLVDSAGLELLLDLDDSCRQGGGFLHLAAPTPLCREILAASGVAQQLTIFDGLTAAAGSYSR